MFNLLFFTSYYWSWYIIKIDNIIEGMRLSFVAWNEVTDDCNLLLHCLVHSRLKVNWESLDGQIYICFYIDRTKTMCCNKIAVSFAFASTTRKFPCTVCWLWLADLSPREIVFDDNTKSNLHSLCIYRIKGHLQSAHNLWFTTILSLSPRLFPGINRPVITFQISSEEYSDKAPCLN